MAKFVATEFLTKPVVSRKKTHPDILEALTLANQVTK